MIKVKVKSDALRTLFDTNAFKEAFNIKKNNDDTYDVELDYEELLIAVSKIMYDSHKTVKQVADTFVITINTGLGNPNVDDVKIKENSILIVISVIKDYIELVDNKIYKS